MHSLFTQRKAQLEIQFNWLFVLIVGAIILAFFLTIIRGQQDTASVEEATELVQSLDTVFNTLSNTANVIDEFNITRAELEFVCELDEYDAMLSEYYIQGAGPVNTEHDIIFLPGTLYGNRIIVWTQLWEAPFEVGIFTYMANEKTLFVFVNNTAGGGNTQEQYDILPEKFTKIFVNESNLASLETKGFDHVFYIISGTNFFSITSLPDVDDRMHLRAITDTDVYFYDSTNSDLIPAITGWNSMPYIDDATLFGALFSENIDFYNCTMEKVVTKYYLLSSLLSQRVTNLMNSPTFTASSCYDYHSDAQGEYAILVTATTNNHWENAASAIASNQEELVGLQQRLARVNNLCPHIY